MTEPIDDERFRAYLAKAYEEVMGWPDWKRGLLGWRPTGRETSKAVELAGTVIAEEIKGEPAK